PARRGARGRSPLPFAEQRPYVPKESSRRGLPVRNCRGRARTMDFTPADPVSVGLFVLLVVVVLASIVLGGRVAAVRTGQSAAAWTIRLVALLTIWVSLTSGVVLSGALSGEPFPAFPLFFAFILTGALAFALSRFGALLAAGVPL